MERGERVVTNRGAGCDGRKRIVRRAMRERAAKARGPGTPGLVLSLVGDDP